MTTSSTRSGKVYRVEVRDPDLESNNGLTKSMANYLSKKTITQGLLDVALLTANVSQLKYVYSVGSDGPNAHPFYYLMMTLISLSIILQITTGLCLILIGKSMESPHYRHADLINNSITIQVFFITVLNVLISSFGIEESVIRTERLITWEMTSRQFFENCTCADPNSIFYSSPSSFTQICDRLHKQ